MEHQKKQLISEIREKWAIPEEGPVFIVKTNREIYDDEIYQEILHRNLEVDIPRRKVPSEIDKVVNKIKNNIFWPDNSRYIKPVSIIHEFDLENRWYSLFRKAYEDGTPLHKSEKFGRIRLLDLFHQYEDYQSDRLKHLV